MGYLWDAIAASNRESVLSEGVVKRLSVRGNLFCSRRKAAEEIRERLTVQLQGSVPHVMTFHALAYALVHPEESILFDEPDGQQSKSRALQTLIDDYLRTPYFYEKIRALMMAHFREDWERIALGGYEKIPEKMLRYRRSLPREGLDGTYFKSFGEKVIADFLFEHDITYRYERNFWWDGVNYRPDFTVFTGDNQGIVIEYFGLEGDPDYDAMSDEKRNYIGNTLMQGLGTPARVHKSELGIVEIADLGKFHPVPKEEEDHPGDSLTPAVLRLVDNAIKNGRDVILLSRKNSLPWYVNFGKRGSTSRDDALDSFLKLVRSYFPEDLRHKVTISTAHKYKGLEKKVVIVLDAVPRCYPLLHSDLMFTRVLGDTIERVIDEERRLFYVALTRAVEHLFILTEANNVSPFLEDLKSRKTIPSLNWSDYPPLVGSIKRITARVGNQDGRGGTTTYAIKDLLKAEGYRWNTTGWKAWCRTCPAQNFSVQEFLTKAMWISRADGIELRFYDDLENMLAIYRIDRGQWTCVVDNIPDLEFAGY